MQRTRYYAGPGYEKDLKVGSPDRDIHYIDSPAGLIAIVVREGGNDTYHYVYTDHLGTILTTTDNAGQVETVAEQNFDAWGRRRNPTTWAYTAVTNPPDWLYRGYTSHEQLDLFGLINMNGRLYDPAVGRVLSPDNFVQDPFSTQGFNRYAYGLNNPLKYTDPDGQFIHIIVGAVVGGLINGFLHIDRPGGFWKGAAIGAAAGALVAATGGAAAVAASTGSFAGAFSAAAVSTASSGAIGGAIAATAGTAIGSPVLGLGNKAVFGDPYSLKQYGKDVLFAGITGGVASGLSSALGGKNFWTGKATSGTSTFDMPDKAFFRWRDQKVGKVSAEDLTATWDPFIDDNGNLIKNKSFDARFPNQGVEFLDDGARMVEQPFIGNNIVPQGKLANHIFSGKPGKLIDTPANRNLLSDLINNRNNFMGVDSFGKSWYSRILDNREIIFGYTKNGILKGAGISQTPDSITRGLILNK